MKKYYIVFYNYTDKTITGEGYCCFKSDEVYLNRKKIQSEIIDYFNYTNSVKIIFTNIIELNKAEYDEWNR